MAGLAASVPAHQAKMADKTALLIAAHGDRGGRGGNAALLALCQGLEQGCGFATVAGGVLKGEPPLEAALEQVLAGGASRLLVYPLFMAAGYFTKKVLPGRIMAHLKAGRHRLALTFAAPLGTDQALPALSLRRSLETAQKAGFDPAGSRLLIVGHGSGQGPESARATRDFAARVRQRSPFACVETAFLEEEVFLKEALRQTSKPTVVEGFFSGDGMHAGDDVPTALAETGANAVYAGSIGADPRLGALIAASVGAFQI